MLKNRLGLRLSLYVLGITAGVMLLAGGAMLRYSWQREWAQVNTARQDLATVRLAAIVNAVWDLSRSRMQEEVDALLTVPHLAWAEIRLSRYTVSAGDSSGVSAVVDTFSLVHPVGGRIGVLETRFDRGSVESTVRGEARVLLGLVSLAVAVLASAILVLFRWLVSRNLDALARHARGLTLDTLEGEFRLPRRSRPGREDELDNLQHSFNHMRSSLVNEIRNRRQAEADLQVSTESYREIFDTTADALLIHDPEQGTILDVNETTLGMFGYPREELLNQPISILCEDEPPFDSAQAVLRIRAAAGGETQRMEWQTHRKDGSKVHVEVILRSATLSGQHRVLASVRDIGERIGMEMQLRHSRKMDALGQLAGGVAHDFNNMLTGVMGAGELLLTRPGLQDPEAQGFLTLILQTSERAADLVRKLLSFSRKGSIGSVPVDVHAALRGATALLERSLDKRVVIRLDLQASDSTVMGDVAELQNIVINLGLNAGHAMPDGGELYLGTTRIELDAAHAKASPFELVPGPYLRLEVRDTGCGIPAEHIERVFEPFYTTRGPGEGSGLGLAAVYGAVVAHRGELSLGSTVGVGTTFVLHLPLCNVPTTPEGEERHARRGKGRLLVIDDEAVIRTTIKACFGELGYEVDVAADGEEGLRTFRECGGSYDLVLLDMAMPVMNGSECFARLRQLSPTARILLSSGYAPGQSLEELERLGAAGFVRKPFRLAELSRRVAELLAPEAGRVG